MIDVVAASEALGRSGKSKKKIETRFSAMHQTERRV